MGEEIEVCDLKTGDVFCTRDGEAVYEVRSDAVTKGDTVSVEIQWNADGGIGRRVFPRKHAFRLRRMQTTRSVLPYVFRKA